MNKMPEDIGKRKMQCALPYKKNQFITHPAVTSRGTFSMI